MPAGTLGPFNPDDYPNLSLDLSISETLAGDEPLHSLLAQVERAALATLLSFGRTDAALTVELIDDEEMRALNSEWRDVDAPTDVLSFAAQEGDLSLHNMPDDLRAELERELGGILIAAPYARRQAARFGNSFEHELMLLTVHGLLHLLGHDHATAEDEAAMWALQEQILRPLGVVGLSLRPHDE